MRSSNVYCEANANQEKNPSYFNLTLLLCVDTDLVWHSFGLGTNMDEEDRGQRQCGFQSQSVSCGNFPGSIDMRVLTQ